MSLTKNQNLIYKFIIDRSYIRQMSMEQKQTFLREAILEKGIDAEVFFEYWSTLAIELEDVTISMLESVVAQFLEKHPHTNHSGQEQEQFTDFQEAEERETKKQDKIDPANFNWDFLRPKHNIDKEPKAQTAKRDEPIKPILRAKPSLPQQRKPQQSQVKKQASKPVSTPTIAKQSLNLMQQITVGEPLKQQKGLTVKQVLDSSKLNTIKCLKLQENVLSHHTNVEIMLTNVAEVEDNSNTFINKFIRNTFLLFTIKTVARNKNRSIGISWEVKRRPQDFQWLRHMLVKCHPGIVVPPLPPIAKTKQKVSGYQKKLEHFLLDCYRCPQLKNSKHFQIFLSYSNPADYDGYVKNSETVSKPKDLNHILNMTGVVQTLFSKNIDQYGEGLRNYLNKTSHHLKQAKLILHEINEAYDKISNEYKNLANVFFQMSDESHSFSDEVCYQRLANTYKQIAILSGLHSTFCEEEKDLMDAYMDSHFAYEKDRLDNMQSLITKREMFAAELAKRVKQQESKGGMFGKIASFFGERAETVDSPSANYDTLNNQVGFYNNQLLRESVRCVEGIIQSHINHFSGYGHTRIDNVDNMQKTWSNILVEFSKLNASNPK